MRKKISISCPYIQENSDTGKARLLAQLCEDGKNPYTAWYEVDSEYAQYLCTERTDAFVTALLPYAMRNDLDIYCEQVLSERLHYQITQHLIPALSSQTEEYHRIEIISETSNETLTTANAVGASLSGGVDSFYTLLNHLDRKEKHLNITHLAFFNVGASGDCGGEDARALYRARIAWIREVADSLQIPLLCVDSNISEFIGLPHVSSHTFRTLSVVLALQKLFDYYIFASGYPYQKFAFSADDSAMFDLLTTQCLSTENLTIQLSGAELSRMKKVAFIANYEVTHKKLNVCFAQDRNCSRCPKCRRTMMDLYVLNKLDLYREVFDVDGFYASLNSLIADVCGYRKSTDWDEIYLELKRRNQIKLYHHILGGIRAWIRKQINRKGIIRTLYLKIRGI